MIIHLDLDPDAITDSSNEELTTVLHELLRSHRKGYHYIIIKPFLADVLIENIDFNRKQASDLKQIRDSYYQNGQMLRHADFLVSIDDKSPTIMLEQSRKICIPIEIAVKSNLFEQTRLVVEHIVNDGKIFEFIFSCISREYQFPPTNFSVEHGGGSSVKDVCEIRVQEKRIVSALVDSDSKSPFSLSPNCANMKLSSQILDNYKLFFPAVLPCSELENILDIEELGCITQSEEEKAFLSMLISIKTEEDKNNCDFKERFIRFVDLKNGIDNDKVSALNQKDREWFEQKLSMCGIDSSSVQFKFSGFGNSIIKRFLESKTGNAVFAKSIKRTEWSGVFSRVFLRLAWIHAAPKEKRT